MANVYKINADALRIPVVTSDPGSPEDGSIWYNSTAGLFKKRENGATTTIASGNFADNVFYIYDNGDATKKIAFEASGITTGTTRTILMPDADVDLGDVNNAILVDGSRPFTSDQSMGSNKLTNLADPTSAQEAATKAYVDSFSDGRSWKAPVRVASTANIDLSVAADPSPVDGVTLAAGDRILLKNQTAGAENGLYDAVDATDPTTWVRTTDANTALKLEAAAVFVEEGTSQHDYQYAQTADSITLDTTPLVWVVTSANAFSGHDMITLTGGQISVDLASTSGLESTNPGNAAGQLRIKSDVTTANTIGTTITTNGAGTKFDSNSFTDSGSETLALASGVAGDGLALTSGVLSVNVDGSTIETNSDTLRVKDGGISNVKIATGVDAAKIANGSVSNTEFQYLDGVTSAIQTQIDAKVTGPASATDNALARFDTTTGKLVQNSGVIVDDSNNVSGFGVLVHGANGLQVGSSTSNFFEEQYIHSATLAAATTAVVASFTFATASFEGAFLEYKMKQATSSAVRVGTLYVATDGTNTSITDTMTETADAGITWTAAINGANLEISYTNAHASRAVTMRTVMKRIKA